MLAQQVGSPGHLDPFPWIIVNIPFSFLEQIIYAPAVYNSSLNNCDNSMNEFASFAIS